jgi:hypothetical protein
VASPLCPEAAAKTGLLPRLAIPVSVRNFLCNSLPANILKLVFNSPHPIIMEALRTMALEVPPLSYAYEALEPFIDSQTMHLHHDKHHQAYVDNSNAAIAKTPELAGKSPEELLANLAAVPEAVRGAIRNNVGGHVNH